jgi:hypothetical protein
MKNYKKIGIVTAALAVVGFTQTTQAALAPGLLISETGFGDVNVAMTFVTGSTYTASYGDYVFVVTTGQTIIGGSTPIMDMAVEVTLLNPLIKNPPPLVISYSDGGPGFGPSGGSFFLTTALGSGTSGSISTSAYVGSSAFDTSTLLGGSADVIGQTTINGSGPFSGASGYYLTIQDVINGNVSSADTTLSVVPEPTTVVAAALMLLPLGIGAARCLRKDRIV